MHPLLQFFLGTFVALFPIVNPIGNAPVFVALTEGYTPRQRHRIAQRTTLYTFVLLSVFLFLGGSILRFFGISLEVIRIAGGLVVFHAAWGMLNADPKLSETEHQESKEKADVAFFPLTMPLIAGPGAIAVTLGLAAQAGRSFNMSTMLNLLATFVGIGLVVVVVYACLRSSDWLFKGLGETGIKTLTRIFGFLISAVGVQLILSGLQDWIETLSIR
ncbi:MAG TPA: MarC family NAAT transporter [Candidatus Caenarcaniphilales bacterium]